MHAGTIGIWLEFALCLLLIAVAGARLTRYGDAIADKTGLGGSWIGLILLATVTSLPELANGVSSVTLADVPNIAVGNLLGACVFNLLIFMLIDVLQGEESMYTRVRPGHVLSAAFGVLLLGYTALSLLLARNGANWAIGHVGVYAPVILLIYAAGVRTIFRYERRDVAKFAASEPDRYPHLSLRAVALRYAVAAAVVVGAGLWLPFVGAGLADAMGWSESFVGTVFIAIVTTLPELVVTLAAVRLGALDMAVANLFGSNLFNILVIAVDDAFYLPGPLLAQVAETHAVSALAAVMMSGVAIVGLFFRARGRVLKRVGWASLALLAIYLLNVSFAYLHEQAG